MPAHSPRGKRPPKSGRAPVFLGNLRRKAALVAHARGKPLFLEQRRQRVVGFRAHPQRRTEILRADGTIINSCTSSPFPACTPPLRMFIIGMGVRCACAPPRKRNSATPCAQAAALAQAIDTASVAFAPRTALFFRAVQRDQCLIDGEQIPASSRAGRCGWRRRCFAGLQHALPP